jgi:nucleoside-diphosphate-sugar epimerase
MSPVVTVTGASGFIGNALVKELLRRNMSVNAVSRQKYIVSDQANQIIVNSYDQIPDDPNGTIIHLAETSDVAVAEKRGEVYISEARARASALIGKKFKRFIYISSGMVYGTRSTTPHKPNAAVVAGNIYNTAKLAVEKIVKSTDGIIVRLCNVYGPPLKSGTFFSDVFSQIPESTPLKIRDGNPARDFLWIDDVVKGLVEISIGSHQGTFNLGSGKATTTTDLTKIILEIAGQPHREIISSIPNNNDEINSLALDTEITTKLFGWEPQTSFHDGIRTLFNEQHD